MGWLAQMFGLERDGAGKAGALTGVEVKLTTPELAAMLRGGSESGAGARVTWSTALQVTTVLACVRVLAEGVAQVPWKLFRGGPVRSDEVGHPVHDLIHRRPNPWQTSFEFRETLVLHAALTGNAYVRKLRVGSERRLASLELLVPQRTRHKVEPDGRIRYWHTPEGGSEQEIPAAEIWHVRGPSWDSVCGLDATRMAREAIGLAIATESAHADLHRNGVRTSGFYSMEDVVTDEQHAQLLKWFEKFNQGGERAGSPMILDHAAKYVSTQMSGVDAQHIETRKHQIEEICRAFRVMPIMVGQSDKAATYASAEQMFLAHVVHTLMPWYERIEQSADVNLLTEEDRRAGLYTKFVPNALMRGAAKDRAEYYAKALGAGGTRPWMTQDEVRGLEEMDAYGAHAAELGTGAMDAATSTAGPDAQANNGN